MKFPKSKCVLAITAMVTSLAAGLPAQATSFDVSGDNTFLEGINIGNNPGGTFVSGSGTQVSPFIFSSNGSELSISAYPLGGTSCTSPGATFSIFSGGATPVCSLTFAVGAVQTFAFNPPRTYYIQITGSSSTPTTEETPAPSYTGPKISSFNLSSVAPGGSLVATGKKLDQIQSATIGGKAATLSYSDNGLAITVPADLAPGTYNLVMQTSYGSLTQLNAVVVKTPKPVSSFTLKGTGSAISSDLASEIKAIGSMYSADYSKIHCVVNTTDEEAAAIATQACSLLKTGSLSAATTLTTLKSTFKGSGFWLRVYLAG